MFAMDLPGGPPFEEENNFFVHDFIPFAR